MEQEEERESLLRDLEGRKRAIEDWQQMPATSILKDNLLSATAAIMQKLTTCKPEELSDLQAEVRAIGVVLKWDSLQLQHVNNSIENLQAKERKKREQTA